MLHDIVFALAGFPGNVIVDGAGTFALAEDIPLVHPSERAVLNAIVAIGSHYRTVRTFVNETLGEGARAGLYMHALAGAIDAELDSYRKMLVKLEQRIVTHEHTPLGVVANAAKPFEATLVQLASIVTQIKTDEGIVRRNGGAVLALLVGRERSSVGQDRELYHRLSSWCLKVLHRLLASWLVRGVLPSAQGAHEFFIQSSAGDVFRIVEGHLPAFIPMDLARQILFIGEAVHVLHRSKHVTLDKEDEERLEQMFVADSWDDFARTMSVVRRAVSTKLCQILLGPGAAVRDKLSLFCDLFLLRRGDIATAYLAECDKLMLRPAAKADVHTIFRPSCVSAGLGGEDVLDLLDLFTLSVSVPPAKEDVFGAFFAYQLELVFNAESPSDLLFSADVLSRFERLFKYVVTVNRVQLSAHKSWHSKPKLLGQLEDDDGARLHSFAVKRQMIDYWVNQLQHYIQLDVIASAFEVLQAKFNKASLHDDLTSSLEEFLTTVEHCSFLSTEDLRLTIGELLKAAHLFHASLSRAHGLYSHMQQHLDKTAPLERGLEGSLADADAAFDTFTGHIQALLHVLGQLQSNIENEHVARFLLQVDYSGFFKVSL